MSNATNSCQPVHIAYPDLVDETALRVTFSVLCSVVFLCGFTGNLLVIYFWCRTNVQFHVRRIFVLSLTLADMQVLIFAIPTTCVQGLLRIWYFGLVACHVIPFLQATATLGTSFTLALIASDRYLTVKYPYGSWVTNRKAVVFIVVAWFLAFVWSLPYGLFMKLTVEEGVCGYFCDESWPHGRQTAILKRTYFAATGCLQFLFPLLVFLYCFHKISRSVTRQVTKRFTMSKNLSESSKSNLVRRRRGVNRMLIIMLCAFIGAWLPQNVMSIVRDIDDSVINYSGITVIYLVVLIIGLTSSIWNPVIYTLWNREFRTALRNVRTVKKTRNTLEMTSVEPTMSFFERNGIVRRSQMQRMDFWKEEENMVEIESSRNIDGPDEIHDDFV